MHLFEVAELAQVEPHGPEGAVIIGSSDFFAHLNSCMVDLGAELRVLRALRQPLPYPRDSIEAFSTRIDEAIRPGGEVVFPINKAEGELCVAGLAVAARNHLMVTETTARAFGGDDGNVDTIQAQHRAAHALLAFAANLDSALSPIADGTINPSRE